jgi:hypothetical protein
MLLDILVTVPSLILAEIAWCVRLGMVLTCTTIPFALAMAEIRLYCRATCRAASPAKSINSLAPTIKRDA